MTLNVVILVSMGTMMACIVWNLYLMSRPRSDARQLLTARTIGGIAAGVGLIAIVWRLFLG